MLRREDAGLGTSEVCVGPFTFLFPGGEPYLAPRCPPSWFRPLSFTENPLGPCILQCQEPRMLKEPDSAWQSSGSACTSSLQLGLSWAGGFPVSRMERDKRKSGTCS